MQGRFFSTRPALLAALLLGLALGPVAGAAPLTVCATVPDLADIAREVGGEEVEVTSFAKGTEDPHFVEPRPSFVARLSRADLYLQVGLGLESAWAPALLRSARNPEIAPGGRRHLDASLVLSARDILEVPKGKVSRAQGDVHPYGNPHFLLDPILGLKVARAIRDRLAELRPGRADYFRARYVDFERRTAEGLLGKRLLSNYAREDIPKLLLLAEYGKLEAFLEKQGQADLLGGWLARLKPHRGKRVIADHNLWPYFARRYGIEVAGFLEPKPGITPTTRHLAEIIALVEREGIRAVLSSSYFNPRYARFVAGRTGARIVEMAQQTGARPGAETWLKLHEYNVKQLAEALEVRP